VYNTCIFILAQANKEQHMPIGTTNSQIAGCGTHHIAIQTRDWAESLAFYQDVLGMKLVAEFCTAERPIALLDMGDGSHIELFGPRPAENSGQESPAQQPLMHLALAASDTRAAIEHVRKAGCRITTEPKDVQLGPIRARIAFFDGPSGESIEFFQTL
jgi:glyoxylase I family protein